MFDPLAFVSEDSAAAAACGCTCSCGGFSWSWLWGRWRQLNPIACVTARKPRALFFVDRPTAVDRLSD